MNTRSFSLHIYSCLFFGVVVTYATTRTEYYHDGTLDHKTCLYSERMFTAVVASKVACTSLCAINSGCVGVFYKNTQRECVLCSGYAMVSDDFGTTFMKLRVIATECFSNFNYDHAYVVANFVFVGIGTQIGYSCFPCSYYPPPGTGMMTCQENGTWTTPTCVYGPDIGKLRNGQTIPSGSVGCFSTYGTLCLPYSDSAHVQPGLRVDGSTNNCWCDSQCCGQGDCCYDVNC